MNFDFGIYGSEIYFLSVSLNEAEYRWLHSIDPCAVDLLASGIVRFANDAEKIDQMIKQKL